MKVTLKDAMHWLVSWWKPSRWLWGHRQLNSWRDKPHLQNIGALSYGLRAWAAIAEVTVMMLVVLDKIVDRTCPVPTTLLPAMPIGPSTPWQGATIGVDLLPALALPTGVDPVCTALHFAVQVADVPEHLLITAARLWIAGQCAVIGHVACTLLLHQLVLPLLSFRELGCDHNQAQIYHEERTHLENAQHISFLRLQIDGTQISLLREM